MPRDSRDIYYRTVSKISIADTFVVLHLRLSSGHKISDVRRVRMADVDRPRREYAAHDAHLCILGELLAKFLTLPLDR